MAAMASSLSPANFEFSSILPFILTISIPPHHGLLDCARGLCVTHPIQE